VIEVAFFDAGETILRPYPSFPELFAEVCRRSGLDVDAEKVAEIQQRLAPHLVELAAETGIDAPSLSEEDSLTFWGHLYRRLLGELGIESDALVTELYSTFSSSSSYRLFDDALPALEDIASLGCRLGLISNFEGWLEEMLVELEVGHIFDISIISGLEGMEKPDPAIYALALERAGVDPERALHVGDSPVMDVEPSAAAGMHAVLLDRYNRYEDLDCLRIRSLSELPRLVEDL
jgi:putative hydrolase of the HAD superfamily